VAIGKFWDEHGRVIIWTVVGLAVLVLGNIPQTVGVTAYVVRALPIQQDTKRNAIFDLCQTAYSPTNNYRGAQDCFSKNFCEIFSRSNIWQGDPDCPSHPGGGRGRF
jgi:hypothetical protein